MFACPNRSQIMTTCQCETAPAMAGLLGSGKLKTRGCDGGGLAKPASWNNSGISNSFKVKFKSRLETIATLQASGVARFQLKPIATVGTIAAANVDQPNAPISATMSPE